MIEAFGNILNVDADAIVIPTNGFVTSIDTAVMKQGLAGYIAKKYPIMPELLGRRISKMGNKVHWFTFNDVNEVIVTFPTRPEYALNTGNNVLPYISKLYQVNLMVPGFHLKASIEVIQQSLHELNKLAYDFGWHKIICPEFGYNEGIEWAEIRQLIAENLDDRFIIYHPK